MVSNLVARIRQWLMKPGVMEAVRSAVRECVSEELASNTGPWDLLERPSSELSLQEKCALLAVHHDEVFPEDPVNPWHGLNRQLELADEEAHNLAYRSTTAKNTRKLTKAEAATRRETDRINAAARAAEGLAKANAAKKKATSERAKKMADEAVEVATEVKKEADKAAAPAIEARKEHNMAILYLGLQRQLANPDESQLIRVGEILVDVQQEMGFATDTAAHSDDFRSVDWFGTPYEFTALQAACVRILWENSERNTPGVGQQFIVTTVDSSQERLDAIFAKGTHPAWDTMIVPATTKGSFRLARKPI